MLNTPPPGNPPSSGNPPPGNQPTPNLTPAQQQAQLLAQAMLNSVNTTINLGLAMRDNTNELLDQVGIYRRINIEDKQHISLTRKVTDSLMQVNAELRRSGQIESQLNKDRKLSTQIQVQLGMLQEGMNDSQKSRAQDVLKLKQRQVQMEDLATRYAAAGNLAIASRARAMAASLEQRFIAEEASLDSEQKRLIILSTIEGSLEKSIDLREKENEKASRINKNLGITGAILDNLNKVGARFFGGIGLNLSVLGDGLKVAFEDAYKKAEELDADPKGKGLFRRQLAVIGAAWPGIKTAFLGAVTDPLTIAIGLFTQFSSAFNRIDKASTDVSRITGQTATTAAIYNTNLATTTQYLEKIVELTQKLGFNAQNVFTEEVLGKAAELQNLLGLSAEEAGNLALQSQINGKSVDSNVDAAVRQVSEFNKANRSAVSQGVVLRDVMKAADGITASLGAGTKEIAAAAAAARRLGLELGQLDQIASSLLDFESSIEAELTAQLMTGRDINLSRARELALANNLAGVGKELFENSATLAEFGQMNRIAQEEYARALGMTRDQLARTAYLRALEIGMTQEQAAAAANVSAEEMKRLTVQESIAISLQKIQEALVGPANLLAEILGNTTMLYTILTGISVISLAKLATSFIALKASILAAGGFAAILKTILLGLGGLVLTGLIIAGVTALFSQAESKVSSIKDGIINKDGGLQYSGPKGSIKMAPDDSAFITPDGKIIAGTQLRQPSKDTNTLSTIKVENNNTELITLLRQVVSNTERTATHTKNPTILDPGKLILSQQMYQTTV